MPLTIKTQWITNIIIIGDKDFRFINFVTYSNGDFVVETTPCPGDDRGRRIKRKSRKGTFNPGRERTV